MFFIAYAFKGQVHVFAGQVKIVSHSSCRSSAILKYFCPLQTLKFLPSQPIMIIFSDIFKSFFKNLSSYYMQLTIRALYFQVIICNVPVTCKANGDRNQLGAWLYSGLKFNDTQCFFVTN